MKQLYKHHRVKLYFQKLNSLAVWFYFQRYTSSACMWSVLLFTVLLELSYVLQSTHKWQLGNNRTLNYSLLARVTRVCEFSNKVKSIIYIKLWWYASLAIIINDFIFKEMCDFSWNTFDCSLTVKITCHRETSVGDDTKCNYKEKSAGFDFFRFN